MNWFEQGGCHRRALWRSFLGSVTGALFLGSALLGKSEPIRYAKNFSIERFGTHALLTVRNPWSGAGETAFAYALVPKGEALPSLKSGTQVIRTPVERAALMELVYLGHFEALGLYDRLAGLAGVELSSDQIARSRVESGATRSLASGGATDIESLLMLRADVVFTTALGNPQYDVHHRLLQAKQSVAVTAEYMETHPLGRAEWIKFTAAFFEKDREAAAVFDAIAERYQVLAAWARSAKSRPKVFANAPYGGVWHVPGGRSFMARLIADAGGDYVFSDDPSTGGAQKAFESVYARAADAAIWINPGQPRSLRELLALDERFDRFAAFRSGRVYNNTLRLQQRGANPVWERGVLHPEEILADMIAIFHPNLLPDRKFAYYEPLESVQ